MYRYLGDEAVRIPAVLDRTKLTFPALSHFVKMGRSDWTRKMGENIVITQRFRAGDNDRIEIEVYGNPVATIFQSAQSDFTTYPWPEEERTPLIVQWIQLHVRQDNK